MTDIKELKKKRSSYKGRLTVFGNYLETLDLSKLTACQVMELQLRVERLESLYDDFSEIQLQLECLADNIDSEITERTPIESNYYSLLAQAKNMLNMFSKSEQDNSKSDNSFKRQLVKLPTIKLPKFTGSYDNWLEFRDTYTSLIHCNDDIDEINKFHYLRSSLEGTAAVVIQSIEFSSQNYTMAWDLLCERFDNKRLLIQNHISSLFNVEPITRESSAALKQLIDQVNKNIRALCTLGEPVQSWDTLLIYIISRKLDTKTFREWEECKGLIDKNQSVTFDKYIEFLRNRADLLETLEVSRLSHTRKDSTHEYGVTSLELLELRVPAHVALGARAQLSCRWALGPADVLYSVKWYKDGKEFFRHVPRDSEPRRKFPLPGVDVEKSSPNGANVTLYPAVLETGGRYRCEVSGERPLFPTVSDHSDMVIVALPDHGPTITGSRLRYQIGDRVQVNCTSGRSRPATRLAWYINGEPAPSIALLPPTHEVHEDGLETTSLALDFKVKPKHFRKGDLKLKCLATIATVYWRSNEESVQGDRLKGYSRSRELTEGSRADRVHAAGKPNSAAALALAPYLLLACAMLHVSRNNYHS